MPKRDRNCDWNSNIEIETWNIAQLSNNAQMTFEQAVKCIDKALKNNAQATLKRPSHNF